VQSYKEFEKLLKLFSGNYKFDVLSVYPTKCFVLIYLLPKKKFEEGSEIYILNSICGRLKRFSNVNFILTTDLNQYLSGIGNSLFMECEKTSLEIIQKKKIRRKI
jgi:hypothetical protein